MSGEVTWMLGSLSGATLGTVFGFCIGKYRHHRFLADGFQYLADITAGSTLRIDEPSATAEDIARAFGSLRNQRTRRTGLPRGAEQGTVEDV